MSGNFSPLLTGYYKKDSIPLHEYPRPHFVRDSYLSLNGKWEYAISKKQTVTAYDGTIIVPFSPESILSGVNRSLQRDEYLFYKREVKLPHNFNKGRLFLHFGAVDQEVDVFINDHHLYHHALAYFPFSVELTSFVTTNTFTLFLRIQDKTRTSQTFVGKQKEKRGGIWYTPQSGIWQSVWLESVPLNYLENVVITPSFDAKTVHFSFIKASDSPVEVIISEGPKVLHEVTCEKRDVIVNFPSLVPWSPAHPFLYDVTFKYEDDIVKSYFAFRKISRGKNKKGHECFFLNNEPLFQSGVLDQGYYSDGLLTAPSDEAMIDDIMLLKKMGFNMLRKHLKIEPLRFYYHCDRLGILVWQDMPNLCPPRRYNVNGALAMFFNIHLRDVNRRRYGIKNKAQKAHYYEGLNRLLALLAPFASIITWVPFNEGWGQFNAKEVSHFVTKLDPTRLVDHASGWSDQGAGDYYSEHIYFTKLKKSTKRGNNRIFAITEFGGYSYKESKHSFNINKTFGYRIYHDKDALMQALTNLYMKEALPLIQQGLSVLIYTQLSDVEDEVNGLITYDRKVIKVATEEMKLINEKLYTTFKNKSN